jgi:hypothetical protein
VAPATIPGSLAFRVAQRAFAANDLQYK